MSKNEDLRPARLLRETTPVVVSGAAAPSAAGTKRRREAAAPAIGLPLVLQAARRWWMVAAPAGVLLAGTLAAAAWFLAVPKYEAAAWFRMEEKSPFLAFQNRDDDRTKAFFQTQVAMIRSPLVLGPVIKRPEIAKLPDLEKLDDKMSWLSKEVQVASVGQSELFTIRFVGRDPSGVAKIVNAVADSYFKLREQSESDRVQRVLAMLDREKERRSQEVFRLREAVRELARQVKGRDPYNAKPSAEAGALSPLADLQSRLIAAQVERTVLDARVKASEEEVRDAAPESNGKGEGESAATVLSRRERAYRAALIEKSIAEDAQIREANAVLAAKQAKLAEIEAVAVEGKAEASYKRLDAEIEQDAKTLETMRTEIRARVEKEVDLSLEARRTEAAALDLAKQREELSRLKASARSRQTLEEKLRAEYEKGLADVKHNSGESVELEFKRDELARAEKIYELIAQRALELQTERSAPARVSLLRLAEDPIAPMASPLRNVALAALAGLLLPFGLAVGWERFARRVGDAHDIERQSPVAVLGEIASLPTQARTAVGETARVQESVRVFEESIESLRTSLMLMGDQEEMHVLAVTSAAKHEGKTSLASQLAVSLSRATGERVLLIDGDLRSPDIHRIFDIPRYPGVAEVLQGECSARDAIATSYSETLHLLPAGKLAVSPHRLLNNGAWEAIQAELKGEYRYVIIDTPPTLAASEALVLARGADATLVCAMRDVSRVDQVGLVCDRLLAAGARPVGIVLSGVPASRYAYRYGTYELAGNE